MRGRDTEVRALRNITTTGKGQEKKKVEVNGTLNTAYLSMHVVSNHSITAFVDSHGHLRAPSSTPLEVLVFLFRVLCSRRPALVFYPTCLGICYLFPRQSQMGIVHNPRKVLVLCLML